MWRTVPPSAPRGGPGSTARAARGATQWTQPTGGSLLAVSPATAASSPGGVTPSLGCATSAPITQLGTSASTVSRGTPGSSGTSSATGAMEGTGR